MLNIFVFGPVREIVLILPVGRIKILAGKSEYFLFYFFIFLVDILQVIGSVI